MIEQSDLTKALAELLSNQRQDRTTQHVQELHSLVDRISVQLDAVNVTTRERLDTQGKSIDALWEAMTVNRDGVTYLRGKADGGRAWEWFFKALPSLIAAMLSVFITKYWLR